MSKHHKNCKWENYTACEFSPCPFCRIEELTEREAILIMKCNDLTRKEYAAQDQIAKLQYLVDHRINELDIAQQCAEIAENMAVPYEQYEQGLAGAFIAKAIRETFDLEI